MREEERVISDEVKRLKEGEMEAMSYLYKQYRTCIMRYVEQFAYYETDAEDLTQDVFETALTNCYQLKDDNNFLGWLFGIAYRQCMKVLRNRYREGRMNSEDVVLEEKELVASQDAMVDLQLQTDIKGMINELPQKQKTVVVAYFYHGLTLQQIAEQFHCPLGTVKTRLRTAKKTMRQSYKDLFA